MNNFPVLYVFIYKQLKEKANGRRYISYKCVRECLRRRLSKIPKSLHYQLLNELQSYKLIKRIGNTNNIRYEIIGGKIDKQLDQYGI